MGKPQQQRHGQHINAFVDMQECVHFTYEYVDGYPVKRTHIIPNGGMDGKMEVRYEYEE